MKKIKINEERDFKGVWIPKEVWLSEDLGWTEKLLLVEIESLDNEKGCFASNKRFHEFFGLSKDRISKMISSLKEKGYISVQLIYHENSKEIKERIIKVDKIKFYGIEKKSDMYSQKSIEGIVEKTDRGIGENNEDNNTLFNNTINNTINNKTYVQQVEPSCDLTEIHFEKFWNTYNKKQDRTKSFASFKKVYKKHSIEEIINHTLNYMDYLMTKDGNFKYQKMATTFLNNFDLMDDFISEKNKILQERNYRNGGYNNGWNERPNGKPSVKETFGVELEF